jgi:hypothetical protein
VSAPKLGCDEQAPVLHQPGDVVDVTAQPVELSLGSAGDQARVSSYRMIRGSGSGLESRLFRPSQGRTGRSGMSRIADILQIRQSRRE